jgi:hypothetical protein
MSTLQDFWNCLLGRCDLADTLSAWAVLICWTAAGVAIWSLWSLF